MLVRCLSILELALYDVRLFVVFKIFQKGPIKTHTGDFLDFAEHAAQRVHVLHSVLELVLDISSLFFSISTTDER